MTKIPFADEDLGGRSMKDVNAASLAGRQARARLKQRARTGSLSVAEVVLGEPEVMASIRLADVVTWGWPRMGTVSQVKLGKLAARRDLNLLMTCGGASRTSLLAFSDLMWEVRGGAQPRIADVLSAESRDAEVERLQWLLAGAEKARDAALARCEELAQSSGPGQFVMPTVAAECMLAELADAVEEHRRTVTSPTSPADKWCTADEALWARKNAILEADAPKLKAA